ncbi:beta-ketoacyl synthase N-terminal-like domain-containing protein [Nitrincola nitratireducens]|uniref:3-oxoacyl-[acyl-carrier-protein] synthase 2 n=1 Tax=Nitrincola nitratireducens TaxID=1229521 RepID=W9VH36_9GAMM|nr:3-oxoacyl-[acyl-carrier-protein] synthase 2 [Nitrincola nitratireducens]
MSSPIVITGMGIVSPLGIHVDAVWQRLLSGVSGILPIEHFDTSDFPVQIAGLVPSQLQDPKGG